MDKEILVALKTYKRQETKAAIATIIRTKGSTPREKGVSMLIYADGRTVGTIGGGCAEAEIKKMAFIAMDNHEALIHPIDLYGDLAAEEGMVCGGTMDVILEPIQDPYPFQLMEGFQANNELVYSCLVVEGEKALVGKRAVFDQKGLFIGGANILTNLKPEWLIDEPKLVMLDMDTQNRRRQVLLQPIAPPNNLLVLGGGHVAQALVAMASQLDFEITVVDDRVDFANQVRFPGVRVICNSFTKALGDYQVSSSTYIVIVTRGHRYDEECLKKVVSSPAAYIGLIGSRRRTRLLFQQLEEEGYLREDLDKVKTPIGLDIGGETPGEIAVSILAEIILIRRKGYREGK